MTLDPEIEAKAMQIRQAIEGGEVRESLASGIEFMDDKVNTYQAEMSGAWDDVVQAENERVAAEQARVQAETTRQQNETSRQTAESNRVSEFSTMKNAYDSATHDNTSVELTAARTSGVTGKTYGNVGSRMDNVDSQLAEKTNQGALGKIIGQSLAAHRGFGNVYPQNTVVAFENACKCGADVIETDIYYTTDNNFICSHDNDIAVMTDGTGAITTQSSTDILSHSVINGSNIALFPGLKMCTLDEMLQVCKRYNKIAMPEFKTNGCTWTTDLLQSVINLILKYGMEEQVIMQSFDLDVLQHFRTLNKNISLLYLGGTIDQAAVDNAKQLGNTCLGIATTGVNADNLNLAHSNEVKVAVWTLDDYPTFDSFKSMGADMLMSDKYFA